MVSKKGNKTAVKAGARQVRSTKKPKVAKKAASTSKLKQPTFHVVGMGASAGGLEAFQEFFSGMPADSGIAFILVPHLDPSHISILPEIIQKSTEMEVITVEDGTKIQKDRVYITPANKDMAVLQGAIQLIDPIQDRALRLPIDYFLRSLAADLRERAVGIILSGMGSDGTLGIKAIKEELGLVMVQDPATAKFDSMPRNAVNTGMVDYILSPRQMSEQLLKYTRHATQATAVKAVPVEGEVPNALKKVIILLRDRTGHDFSLYKVNTLCRRIERRLNVHQIDNVSDYLRFVQKFPHEIDNLYKDLLIGVTNFFRDPEAFDILENQALPMLMDNKPEGYIFRVWVAGCSTGEEAYSIGIAFKEHQEKLNKKFEIQIFGTDIDAESIDVARAGIYQKSGMVDISQERLDRYFLAENSSYQIRKDIREMLIFATHSIIKDPPFTKMDLISCRNLLIYLEPELQKKLLPMFHYCLNESGVLFLGPSETTGGYTDLFSTIDKKWKIYQAKPAPSLYEDILELPLAPTRFREKGARPNPVRELNITQVAEKVLLEKYAPPSVIINTKGDIIYIHGSTGNYLELAPGTVRWNILDMARGVLRTKVPLAIRAAVSQKQEVRYDNLVVKSNGVTDKVHLIVKPLSESEATRGLMMVVFQPAAPLKSAEPVGKKEKSSRGAKVNPLVDELEQELRLTRESLQTTVEELETSNEELKSTNEELQSTNEELQSSNEELETSKEELQSVNEELITVNTELEEKNRQFESSNDDMKNLLNSIDIPTIFLDSKMRIKRFTSNIEHIANLISSDIGRPISDISTKLTYKNMEEDAVQVMEKLGHKVVEVQTREGAWYSMSISPYRTYNNVLDGVVITFSDIGELISAANEKEEALALSENIIQTLREPFLVLDGKLQIISTNSAFYSGFKSTREKTLGKYIYDLGNRQWDIPDLRRLLEEIIPRDNKLDNFEVVHEFPEIGIRRFLLNARKVKQGKGTGEYILIAFENVPLVNPGAGKEN
jgi:two-component system CheB/CheR fusion protein